MAEKQPYDPEPPSDRASDSHPVMNDPRGDAMRAYRKRFGKNPPKGWPYTDADVKLANQLIGIQEDGDGDNDASPQQDMSDPSMQQMLRSLMLKRIGG